MRKKSIMVILFAVISIGMIYRFFHLPLPSNHGGVDHQLFLTQQPGKNPLVVGFGGSEGGMIYAEKVTKPLRDRLKQSGYHFLAIGYFGTENSPVSLDRIALDAIYDTIKSVGKHPLIDEQRVVVLGGSRGAELALNLASRYGDIGAVIAIVPAHVSTCSDQGKTGGWTFEGEVVPFVPTTFQSVKHARRGDFLKMYQAMFEDQEAVDKARIEVEKINGPILFISARQDETWPSTMMSDQMVERLNRNNFPFYKSHIILEGGHATPANRPDLILGFLRSQFPVETE